MIIAWYSTPAGVAPIVDAIFYKHVNPPGLKPQDPNDEPAEVLLERIRKEKEKRN